MFGGAPLYRLSVGQSSVVPPGGSDLCLSDDFVPGEVIVTLKSAGDPAAKTATSDAVLAARYKTSRKGGDPGRAMLLKLPTDAAKVVNGMTPWSRAASDLAAAPPRLAAPPRRRSLAGASRAPRSSASSTLSSMPSCCAGIPTSGAPTSTA